LRAAARRGRPEPGAIDSANAWLATRDASGRFDHAALIEHTDWAALVPAIERARADASVVLPRLAEYLALVLTWNRTVSNLISRGDESRLVARHLGESLDPAGWLAQFHSGRWIDLGTGAGFPALPLAISGIGSKWLLVESRRPKTLFLRRVIQDLGLTNVEVVHARLEDLVERARQGDDDSEVIRAGGFPFDAFTSRATLTLAPTLALAAQCLRVGGHALLWKGSGRVEEKLASSGWAEHWTDAGEHALGSGAIAICNFILRK